MFEPSADWTAELPAVPAPSSTPRQLDRAATTRVIGQVDIRTAKGLLDVDRANAAEIARLKRSVRRLTVLAAVLTILVAFALPGAAVGAWTWAWLTEPGGITVPAPEIPTPKLPSR